MHTAHNNEGNLQQQYKTYLCESLTGGKVNIFSTTRPSLALDCNMEVSTGQVHLGPKFTCQTSCKPINQDTTRQVLLLQTTHGILCTPTMINKTKHNHAVSPTTLNYARDECSLTGRKWFVCLNKCLPSLIAFNFIQPPIFMEFTLKVGL